MFLPCSFCCKGFELSGNPGQTVEAGGGWRVEPAPMALPLLLNNRMNSSMYGLSGRMMVEQNLRLQTVADNLANSATPGYRRSRVLAPSFDQILKQREQAPEVAVDLSEGSLRVTENPLDFSIAGKGFFVLEANGRRFLSRNGQFLVSGEGNLVTPGGLTVQGEAGPINLPPDTDMRRLTVDADGSVRAEGRPIGKLMILEPLNPGLLRRQGPSLFATSSPEDTRTPEDTEYKVLNRSLEGSNAVVFEELAEMMTGSRSFDMSQKMMKAQTGAETEMIKTYGNV